ncbi:hypothetical protein Tco_0809366 [Tanacetum coccineum]
MKRLTTTFNFGDQFLHDKPTEDDQEKSKAREESDSTIPDTSHQTETSIPPVIAPFTEILSLKTSITGRSSPINTGSHNNHHISHLKYSFIWPSVEKSERRLSSKPKKDNKKRKQDSTYSIRSTGIKVDLAEFDLKRDDRSPWAMDKEVADKVKDHKRKHDSDDDEDDDDDDEGPSAGSNQGRSTKRRKSDSAASGSAKPPPKADDQSSKRQRESEASASKQHPSLSSTGWQITDTREAGVDSSMHRSDPESEHSEQSTDDMSKQDEGNVSDMEDTDNAHIPKVSTTTKKQGLKRKTYDIGRSSNGLQTNVERRSSAKHDFSKVQLQLAKPFTRTVSFLHYQMDECHKLLTIKVVFDRKKLPLSISKLSIAARYLDFGLEELVPSLVGLRVNANMTSVRSMASLTGGLEEGNVNSTNRREFTLITDYYFKEDYTIVPKPRAVVYRDINNQRKLMRLNELHKFSDGTLTRVMEKLDQMVKDFHLYEFNKGMETKKWSEDDKRRSKDFITAIEKRLQIRRIYRSLESFVGGRVRDIDYRLINRTT